MTYNIFETNLQLLQDLIDIFPFYVMILDKKQQIVLINKKGLAIKGIELCKLKGENCYCIYHNLDHPYPGCPLERAIINRTVEEEVFYETILKKWIRAKVYPLPLQFNENNNELYLHFSEDITYMKNLEEEALKSESLDRVRLMSRGLSYDIMNALQVVISHATIAQMNNNPDDIQNHLNQIITTIEHIRQMIAQLSKFSSDIILEKKLCSINEIIRDIIKINHIHKDIIIDLFLDENIPFVNIDHYKITEVLQNLILNAIQSINIAGNIKISTNVQIINQNSDVGLTEGLYILLQIKDSGCGIPKENLSKIFNPMFTTKKTGTGLGLTMSLVIVKAHNGTITVESELDHGSTFSVYLPIRSTI